MLRNLTVRCRSPYGERGLKYVLADAGSVCEGRSPYGERGLKSTILLCTWPLDEVALLTESVD